MTKTRLTLFSKLVIVLLLIIVILTVAIGIGTFILWLINSK